MLALTQTSSLAAQTNGSGGTVQAAKPAEPRRYPIAFRTGYDRIDKEVLISDAIGYQLIAPLPPELKAASVKGMFWFHSKNSVYIDKPSHIAGIVPAKYFP